MSHYLIDVSDEADPQLLGPYLDAGEREEAAKVKHHKHGQQHALFYLDLCGGVPKIGTCVNYYAEGDVMGTCPLCGDDVLYTPSGPCCTSGHGGLDPVTDHG